MIEALSEDISGLCYCVVIEMNNLNSNGDTLDRLSQLPDSLILEILSLLVIKDVVKTTLLSKRWKNLWITIPCLKFKYLGRDVVKIRNFVYRTLTLWRGTHLREFSICLSSDSESGESLSMDMALWVQFATERKVEDLCIEFHYDGDLLCLPQCLYQCSSIRKLSLYGFNLRIRGDVKWDRLNTLKLSYCVVSEDALKHVCSSSPQLETFTICCHHRLLNCGIRSSSLKKLRIMSPCYEPSLLTIWAPNLDVLDYFGTPHIICLLTDTSSLTEVHLGFFSGSSPAAYEEALCRIIPAIKHVATVKLSASCFRMLRVIKGKYSFSPLLNVKLLTITETWSVELSDIVGLLESFPKLEKLIIHLNSVGENFEFDARDFIESEANILKSNLLQLRTVVITWYVLEASFVEFIGFLLKHATVIEKMVIRKEEDADYLEEMSEAEQKLLSLQRSFPSVELILC